MRRHVEAKDFGAAVESVSTSTDGDSVTEARPRGWGRLREGLGRLGGLPPH